MTKFIVGFLTALVAVVALTYINGYRLEVLTAKDLPGFTEGKVYIVHGVTDPKYGFKFIVMDDHKNHKVLSPWHFGYNYQ